MSDLPVLTTGTNGTAVAVERPNSFTIGKYKFQLARKGKGNGYEVRERIGKGKDYDLVYVTFCNLKEYDRIGHDEDLLVQWVEEKKREKEEKKKEKRA